MVRLFSGLLLLPCLFGQIHGDRIRADVKFLSSDLLEGRGVGTRGGDLATEYIAAQLAIAGAKPAGDNGTYFQRVPLVGVTTLPDSEMKVSKGGQSVSFKWQDEYVASSHRQKELESVDAELVFVGHGITAPDQNWNDFKDTDVRGKVIVLFTNEPQPENPEVFKGKTLTYYGRWIYKYEEAARKGALGAIIIHTPATAGYGWQVVRNSWSKEDPQVQLASGRPALALAGWMTQDAGEKLLKMSGHGVDELLKAADSRDFRPIPLGLRLQAKLKAKVRQIESRNVAGVIEGSDAEKKNEYVIFSAHWDHLGEAMPVNGDKIYNGAIDNGTGLGILLETARAWGALQQKPRRSALFISFTAEEAGLRGAEFYAQHPLVPPSKTAVDLNYDALFPYGPTSDVLTNGAERTSLWPLVQEAAQRMNYSIAPDPRPEQGSYYRSDNFMLARIGIPAFRIGQGTSVMGKSAAYGSEAFQQYNTLHYHQPSDEYSDSWDFSGIEKATRFGFLVGLNAANLDTLPHWNKGDEFYRDFSK